MDVMVKKRHVDKNCNAGFPAPFIKAALISPKANVHKEDRHSQYNQVDGSRNRHLFVTNTDKSQPTLIDCDATAVKYKKDKVYMDPRGFKLSMKGPCPFMETILAKCNKKNEGSVVNSACPRFLKREIYAWAISKVHNVNGVKVAFKWAYHVAIAPKLRNTGETILWTALASDRSS
ncbi:hypothetical protein CEXT_736191 [Caerostris extrusa]|uniref:Uncharacterized protein n=1 Tax=Caerostris extrusa TaxID=172846 RepID=A0AAV4MR76_CAEEX|nr:hypothetical protein CEXT_736191 [Caerostris extrusa]